MTFSAAIPAYNGRKYFSELIPILIKLKLDQIIISDDSSTDDTVEFIRKYFPQVILIVNNYNQGFPKNANIAVSKTTSDIVILLNQDVIPDLNLISATKKHFSDPSVFSVTFNENKNSWAKVQFVNGLLQYSNGPKSGFSCESFWASGASAAFRKRYWDQLGGLDPIFSPGYFEDFDLSYRARKMGYRIIWEPKAVVFHEQETTFNKSYTFKRLIYIKDRNYLLLHWKNLDKHLLIQHLSAVLTKALHHPGYLRPIMGALLKLPYLINHRAKCRTLYKISDQQLFNL